MKYTFEMERGDALDVISTLELAELPFRRLAINGLTPDTVRSYARNEADALRRIARELDQQFDKQDCEEEEND